MGQDHRRRTTAPLPGPRTEPGLVQDHHRGLQHDPHHRSRRPRHGLTAPFPEASSTAQVLHPSTSAPSPARGWFGTPRACRALPISPAFGGALTRVSVAGFPVTERVWRAVETAPDERGAHASNNASNERSSIGGPNSGLGDDRSARGRDRRSGGHGADRADAGRVLSKRRAHGLAIRRRLGPARTLNQP